MVASTMAYSMSGSADTAANSRFQISAFTQSRKRVKVLFQWPNEGGRSRQGLPVRAIHSTASTKSRLSLPLRSGSLGLPSMEYTMVDATIVKVHRHGQGAKGGPKAKRSAARKAA